MKERNKYIMRAIQLLCISSLSVHAYEMNEIDNEKIVVSASGYEQNIKDAPATITIIDKEEIEGRYYRDVSDVSVRSR